MTLNKKNIIILASILFLCTAAINFLSKDITPTQKEVIKSIAYEDIN